jgi:hypothetical protein
MRSVGEGSSLWRVRVDLFAADDSGERVDRCTHAMDALLVNDEGVGSGVGVDQGTGITRRPVVGLSFWVRANDVGSAATTAVDAATRAGAAAGGVGPDLYDVVVIPENAVARPDDPGYPDMPD